MRKTIVNNLFTDSNISLYVQGNSYPFSIIELFRERSKLHFSFVVERNMQSKLIKHFQQLIMTPFRHIPMTNNELEG